MKVLSKPNVDGEILRTHDIVTNAVDTLGRNWKLAAWPKTGGVVAFFASLSDLRVWERQVLDVRACARGELTLIEKMLACGVYR